jgi:hypothetical protein
MVKITLVLILAVTCLPAIAADDPDLALMDSALALQKRQTDSARIAEAQAQHIADSIDRYTDSLAALPSHVDDVPKSVVISSRAIDSLQYLIDSVHFLLARNKHYKQALGYSVADKIKYLKFILKNRLESRESVQIALGRLILMVTWEELQIHGEIMRRDGRERVILLQNLRTRQAHEKQLIDYQLSFNSVEEVREVLTVKR